MRPETIQWVGGEHDFMLPVTLLEALEQRCNGDGVGLIYQRLTAGVYGVKDITATLALGLEGGGMERAKSVTLVRTLYEDHGLMALAVTAQAVLGLALMGWPDDKPGEEGVETPENS